MGAFDETSDTITLHGPTWEAHETVEVRYIPMAEDESWVHNQLVKYQTDLKGGKSLQDRKTASIENHTGEAKLLWVARMIVAWTFTKGGLAMPVGLASVRKMKLTYIDYIYDEIMKHQENLEMSEEEEEDFTNGASTTTEEIEEETKEAPKPSRNYLSKS